MKTVDQLITEIFAREGGAKYTNKPGDKGGPTKYGVTQKALSAYRGKPCSPEDVQNLQEPEARAIYLKNYIQGPGYDRLAGDNAALIEQLIDAGVNHGVDGAIQIMQHAVGVGADGKIGPVTIAACQKFSDVELVVRFISARAHYYGDLLDLNKNHKAKEQWQFAAGWINRVGDMLGMFANELKKS